MYEMNDISSSGSSALDIVPLQNYQQPNVNQFNLDNQTVDSSQKGIEVDYLKKKFCSEQEVIEWKKKRKKKTKHVCVYWSNA